MGALDDYIQQTAPVNIARSVTLSQLLLGIMYSAGVISTNVRQRIVLNPALELSFPNLRNYPHTSELWRLPWLKPGLPARPDILSNRISVSKTPNNTTVKHERSDLLRHHLSLKDCAVTYPDISNANMDDCLRTPGFESTHSHMAKKGTNKKPPLLADDIALMAFARLVILCNELFVGYSFLRYPALGLQLVPLVVQAVLLDLGAIVDIIEVLEDHGVDTTFVRELYDDDFILWRKFRNDAAHLVDSFHRRRRKGQNRSGFRESISRARRMVVAYDVKQVKIYTGLSYLDLRAAFASLKDITVLVEHQVIRPKDSSFIGNSVFLDPSLHG